jgi:hypothetical protein
MNTYVRTYIHTYIRCTAYIHAYMGAFIRTHACIHTYIQTLHRNGGMPQNPHGTLTVPINGQTNGGYISASVVTADDIMQDTYAYSAILAANAAFLNANAKFAQNNTFTMTGIPQSLLSPNGPMRDSRISDTKFSEASGLYTGSPATAHDSPSASQERHVHIV